MATGSDLMNALAQLPAVAGQRLGSVLLAPGSTYSLPVLLLSLVVFVLVVGRGRRGRDLRAKVLLRVLVPRRQFGTASGRTDAWFALAGVTITAAALGWALIGAEAVRAAAAPWLGAPLPALLPGWAAMTVATIALFVAYEFAYWLDHAAKHALPALWHFHKVHHQAESLSLLTTFRVHPVDTIVFANIVAVVLGLTQASLATLLGHAPTQLEVGGTNLLVMLAATALTHLQHSHLWITLGPRWGRWLLAPAHHQVHHSRDPRHFNRNLGDVLAIFDRLAGTFWMPAPTREVAGFGVDDGAGHPHSPRAALVDPFVDAARCMVPRPRAPRRASAS